MTQQEHNDDNTLEFNNILNTLDSEIIKFKEKIIETYNKSVDEFNIIFDANEQYVTENNELKNNFAILSQDLEILQNDNQTLKKQLSELKSNSNIKGGNYVSSKEYDKLKKKLNEMKDKYMNYRTLYESVCDKGWENKYYDIQRKYHNLKNMLSKYNISVQDEHGKEGYYLQYYINNNPSDFDPYWIICSSPYAITQQCSCIRKNYPIPDTRVIDIDILLTSSTGIILQVLFTKIGNFVIPEYNCNNDLLCITREIVTGIELKRDQYLKLLDNNILHKQINLLKSIDLDQVYNTDNVTLLKNNNINTLYDVVTYLPNINHYSEYNGIDRVISETLSNQAIEYLNTAGYIDN